MATRGCRICTVFGEGEEPPFTHYADGHTQLNDLATALIDMKQKVNIIKKINAQKAERNHPDTMRAGYVDPALDEADDDFLHDNAGLVEAGADWASMDPAVIKTWEGQDGEMDIDAVDRGEVNPFQDFGFTPAVRHKKTGVDKEKEKEKGKLIYFGFTPAVRHKKTGVDKEKDKGK